MELDELLSILPHIEVLAPEQSTQVYLLCKAIDLLSRFARSIRVLHPHSKLILITSANADNCLRNEISSCGAR